MSEPEAIAAREASARGCYCGLWESNPDLLRREGLSPGFCGMCGVCGSPGHTRHAPDGPYTAAWCDRCYRWRSHRRLAIGGALAVAVAAVIIVRGCA